MTLSGSSTAVHPGELIVGRYRVGDLLGRGGMAEVYDGVDERLERKVAIKLLRPEMAAREDVRTRFKAEARAAAGLSHPNAVAVFDTGEHDGVPFLVMERLPGDTLADTIEGGSADPAWLRRSAVGLLGALAAAHEAGIVHRDVKPGNILIARDGTAKITDFGIAKSIHPGEAPARRGVDLTATGQLLGTPNYLAPERLEGEPATPRSDLWALGAVLYEALAGTKPFVGNSAIEIAHAVVNGEHRPLAELRPDVDGGFVAAIERALHRDPDARFGSAMEMAAALELTAETQFAPGTRVMEAPLVRHRTVRTRRTRSAGTPWWPALRGRNALSGRNAVLLGLLGLLVVLVVMFLGGGQELESPLAARERGAATTAATTPTAAPNANVPLPQRIRDLAARLNQAQHGARAADVATGLRQVATAVETGAPSAAAQATAALVATATWYQAGQLTDTAAAATLDLLQQVPGVSTQAAPGAGQTGAGSTVGGGGAKATDKADEKDQGKGGEKADEKGKDKD